MAGRLGRRGRGGDRRQPRRRHELDRYREGYGNGRAEQLVGEAIRSRAERPLIFTKVGPKPYSSGLERDQIRRAVEASLSRLGISQIDVYQVHNFHSLEPEGTQPVSAEAAWETMASLVQEGLVARIGVSNATLDEVRRCEAIHHVSSVQNAFSLLEPRDAGELLPWLEAHGIAYLSYSPLASGLLTRRLTSAPVFPPDDWRSGSFGDYSPLFRAENLPTSLEAAERLQALATDAGVDLSDLALRWALAQPGVTAAIIGTRQPQACRGQRACRRHTHDGRCP